MFFISFLTSFFQFIAQKLNCRKFLDWVTLIEMILGFWHTAFEFCLFIRITSSLIKFTKTWRSSKSAIVMEAITMFSWGANFIGSLLGTVRFYEGNAGRHNIDIGRHYWFSLTFLRCRFLAGFSWNSGSDLQLWVAVIRFLKYL